MERSDLRVVQISGAYVGAQKQIEDAICSELNRHTIDNIILYSIGSSNDSRRKKCENTFEMLLRRFCYKYLFKSHIYARFQTRRLIRIIDRFKPNIVHLHTLHHGYYDFPCIFDYLRKQNIGIVYTVHDMWPFTGGCYNYSILNCIEYRNGCHNCPDSKKNHDCKIRSSAKLLCLKKSCYEKQLISFVAVSEWVRQEIDNSFLKNYDSCVIHNGINDYDSDDVPDSDFANKMNALFGTKKTLLFVAASWTPEKGYKMICELASLLGEEYCLILVGNACEEIRKEAKDNMYFIGYLKKKANLRYLYRNCNLHISASKCETFGMTFVEAAFEGTRSIGFKSTAIQEIVNSVLGVCVENEDPNELKKAILTCIDMPKLSFDEIDRIKTMYSNKTMANKYIDLYWKLYSQRVERR